MKAVDILWDATEEEISSLPSEILIPNSIINDDDKISDYISSYILDKMIEQGLVDEVRSVLKKYKDFPTSMQALGKRSSQHPFTVQTGVRLSAGSPRDTYEVGIFLVSTLLLWQTASLVCPPFWVSMHSGDCSGL